MSVDMKIGNKYLFLSFKIEHRDLQIGRSKDTSFDPLAFNGQIMDWKIRRWNYARNITEILCPRSWKS